MKDRDKQFIQDLEAKYDYLLHLELHRRTKKIID